jgi:spore coat assembly protein SafA
MTATYIVQPGDTLSGIAEKFGVSLSDLERANPQIPNPDLIFPGEVIHIPARHRTYLVQPGDTLSGIAEKFGVSLSNLEKVNPQIHNPDLIFPGQVINIP